MSDVQIFMTEISDKTAISAIIEECCMKQCRIEIVVDEVKYTSKFNGIYFLSFLEMEISKIPEVSWSENKNYKATIFTDNQVFGMICEFKKESTSGLVFSLPSKFFKINRREAFRFKIPSAYDIGVEVVVNNKKYMGRLMDISLDGVGLFFPNKFNFEVGNKASSISFKIDGKEIYSLGEIKVILDTEAFKTKGFKVGWRLEKISGQGQTHIMNYINRNLSQYAKKIA